MSGDASKSGWFLRIIAPPIVLIGGIASFVAFASMREQPEPVDVEEKPPLVEIKPVLNREGVLDFNADGVVVPFRNIDVAAQVEGRIIEKTEACRAGRIVKQDELLLRIDPATFELQVERLTQEREQAVASLKELNIEIQNKGASIQLGENEVALREADIQRMEKLQGRGVSTQQALDNARVAALASRKELVGLQNERRLLDAQKTRSQQAIKLAEAQLAEAQLNLSRCEIRSPGTGVIVRTDVEQGGYVRTGDIVFEFEDTSAVEVRANLEMRILAWLQMNESPEARSNRGPYELPDIPVTVLFEILGNVYSWTGALDRVDGVGVDERTRTVPCRIVVDNPSAASLHAGTNQVSGSSPPALVRGMYVKLLLHSQPREPMLTVPEEAVRPNNVVWAVRDGRLKRIELGRTRVVDDQVIVSTQFSQLQPNDSVVISPIPLAQDGMVVTTRRTEDVDNPPTNRVPEKGAPTTQTAERKTTSDPQTENGKDL